MNKEKWRAVPGYEGLYEVSTHGNVKGLFYGKNLNPATNHNGYKIIALSNNGLKSFRLHRIVASAFLQGYSNTLQVDHIDGRKWNNHISNLRMTTQTGNNANMRKQRKKCSSKYKGVSYKKRERRYRAKIGYNKKQIPLGYFKNEIDAAMAYDKAALEYYGEFAKTNKMLGLL